MIKRTKLSKPTVIKIIKRDLTKDTFNLYIKNKQLFVENSATISSNAYFSFTTIERLTIITSSN